MNPLTRSTLVAASLAACLASGGHAAANAAAGNRAAKTAGPALAEARATLHVTPGALGTPWTFEVTNSDTTPLRVVADGRLLSLDVTPGDPSDAGSADGAPRPASHAAKPRVTVHCALPADVRPATDTENVTVLEPDSTYVEEFDPRLYCFDAHDAAALVPGSRVVAHLGWPKPKARSLTPPFIADESLGGEDREGVKELVADAVISPPPLPKDPPPDTPHTLTVSAPERVDADLARLLEVTVTVENTSSRPIHLVLRPETVAFEVASTKGVFQCASRRYAGSAFPEIFTEIRPHAKASTSVLVTSLCPDEALHAAGLYTLRARIDTRRASGAAIGIDSVDALVESSATTLVRIRHSTTAPGPVTPFAWAKGSTSGGGSHPAMARPPTRPRPGSIRH